MGRTFPIELEITRFDKAYLFLRENEGWFSDDPDDIGGMTIFGIAVHYHPVTFWKVYRAIKKGDVLTARTLTKDFYRKKYWNKFYDEIIDAKLAIRLFDVGVNIGKRRAVKLLQKIVAVQQDGIFGPLTLAGVNNYKDNLYIRYILALEIYYRSRRKFKKFGKGWLTRLRRKID